MITEDGRVKVLDFGLARAVNTDAIGLGEDVTHLGTEVGTIVGTLPYMSP
jgi:serine/threonine protein kinase